MRGKRLNRAARRRVERAERPRHRAGGRVRQAVNALTSSAVALGAWGQNARADSPVDRTIAEYNYSLYEEEDADAARVAVGSTDRYEIKTHQFSILTPLNERVDINVDILHEKMSGASPWNVINILGEPNLIMSGASIDDKRTDLLVKANHYYDKGRASFATGFSTEKDYRSFNFGLDGEQHFNEKNTTLALGLGASFDKVDPTSDPALDPTRPGSDDKQSYALSAGIAQVLDRASTIQSSLSYKYSTGYLSDPYKLTTVGGGGDRDVRPDKRHQIAWLNRYRRHFESVKGSLHADYRFYVDDWGIFSHTVEAAWSQSFWDFIRLIPRVRWYTQSEADFYDTVFPAAAAGSDHSSDFRLSGYGALSYGLTGEIDFATPWTGDRDFTFRVGWETYEADDDYAVNASRQEAPGLVSFDLLTFGLRVKF